LFDFHFALKTMEGIDEDHDLEDDIASAMAAG